MSNLFINDVFWTLQGEGRNMGQRALFVRMPYCNLSCSWCDTKFDTYKLWDKGAFIDFAEQEKARFAVVTGGEPMMHKHTPIVVDILHGLGFTVAVETNGTFAPNAMFDYITCSPKRDANYKIHEDLLNQVSEFKYVVDEAFDFKVIDWHNEDDNEAFLSLSPEFTGFHNNVKRIMEYIKKHPEWRLSLQTHKWIGIP